MNHIQLSDHFNYPKLLRFVAPSVIMMIFTSIYGVVDGFFVSNYVGKTPFAALNLIYPFLMLLGALGFMMGTGGTAIVARKLGEDRKKEANAAFSMLVEATVIGGVILTAGGFLVLRPIARWMGAEGAMLEDCVLYGGILLLSLTAFMLQNLFQSFFVTAEEPKLGLWVMIAAGVTNMVLDALFIAVFQWGLAGAAAASALSQVVGGVLPLGYFLSGKNPVLRLERAKLDRAVLGAACINGSSELMTNISMSLVNILYNFQLMSLAGEDGVAAYGVIMYVNFVFIAIFIGYSLGSAPIISYHYGAQNHQEMKNLFRKSVVLVTITGAAMILISELLARPLTALFVGYDQQLLELTCRGFMIYALSFLCTGANIFGSAFFTALGDGLVSALISFLRTLLFQIVAVMALPVLLGVDGIWLAIVAAELAAMLVTGVFLVAKRKKYHYI
ncbi:MAG: MATE family efflux transporter [Angelakisella sp.]|jgi:putative MATE family efflux protein|nr:MATE family efflux transporter [Angelakisella sp.]